MNSKISNAFKNNKTLIPYITVGDPSAKKTEELVLEFEKAGANIIELGIPFSDPIADGHIIQASHLRALKNDTSLSDAFKLVKRLRKKTQIPLIFMLSINLVEKYGSNKFYRDCKYFGVDGVIVPDKTLETRTVNSVQRTVDTILLVSPTTSNERIKKIVKKSSGFIYLVSTLGITGTRKSLANDLQSYIRRVKKETKKPIAVGFGISTPDQAKETVKYADGVIVGSAIVDFIGKKRYNEAIKLVKKIRNAMDNDQ